MKNIEYNLISKQGCKYRIIEQINYSQSLIEFEDGYIKIGTHNTNSIRNPYFPIILGVGYMGEGVYNSSSHKRIYKVWATMIERCYNNKLTIYEFVTVCEEWKCFQNFAEWYENNYDSGVMEGWYLDKDLFSNNPKQYSPSTCSFLPPAINALLGFIHSDFTIKKINGNYYSMLIVGGKRNFSKPCVTEKECADYYTIKKELQAKDILEKYQKNLNIKIIDKINELIRTIPDVVKYKVVESKRKSYYVKVKDRQL